MVAPGELAAGAKHHPGSVRVMRLSKVYRHPVTNTLVGDVFDGSGTGYYRALRFLSVGGGDGKNAVHLPIKPTGGDTGAEFDLAPEVLVAFSEGARPRAYILGVLPHLSDDLRVGGSEEETQDGEGVIDINGARVVWTTEGNLRLDVTHNNPSSHGHVAITHRFKGDAGTSTINATERVLLGQKFATSPTGWVVGELIAKIDALGAQVETLTTALQALSASVQTVAGAGMTLVPPQGAAQSAFVSAQRGVPTTLDYSYESPDAPTSAYLGKALRISPISEGG